MSKETTKTMRLTEFGTAGTINLASPDEKGFRRFEMHAYTGGEVQTMFGRVVVDLSSLNVGAKRKPILLNHDPATIAGYSEEIEVDDAGIRIKGRLSKTTAAGKEVTELADEGFPWQASIGFNIGDVKRVGDGEMVMVNGREFTGPGAVLENGKLNESSFVPLGADSATSAAVFSDGSPFEWPNPEKESPMSKDTEKTVDVAAATEAAFKDGYATAKAELSAILAAFPTDAAFAVDQFTNGKSLTEAKLAMAEKAVARLAEMEAKLAEADKRLALAAGGQAPVGAVAPAETPTAEAPTDPKARAEWEWDNRQTAWSASSKDRYVAVRKRELAGLVHVKN